jgi:hypothetical protein
MIYWILAGIFFVVLAIAIEYGIAQELKKHN